MEAKGLSTVNKYIHGIIMPTPSAVLKAASLLADGTDEEDWPGGIDGGGSRRGDH